MGGEDAIQPIKSPDQPGKIEIVEKRTSLLQQVKEGLQADERVYFAGEAVYPRYGAGWLEAVDIIVAPVEPIYDADRLNEFMDSLLSEIPRSARDAATKYNQRANFSLGKLYFDETIGETRREIKTITTAVDPEALTRAGVNIGETHKTEEESLERRTWVRVYPDATSAQIVAEYEQGVKEGTVETNQAFEYMKHWFSAEQFEQIKKAGGILPIKHSRLLGKKK